MSVLIASANSEGSGQRAQTKKIRFLALLDTAAYVVAHTHVSSVSRKNTEEWLVESIHNKLVVNAVVPAPLALAVACFLPEQQ